jgi:small-conductance mechanosensitive channel
MQQAFGGIFGPQSGLLQHVSTFLFAALLLMLALMVGWILGVVARLLFVRMFRHGVEDLSRRLGYKQLEQSLGLRITLATLVGWTVQGVVTVIALLLLVSIYFPTTVLALLQQWVVFLPNLFIALTIILVGLFLSQVLADIAYTTARANKRADAGVVSTVVRVGIVVLACIAALLELGVATIFMTAMLVAVLATSALGVGLAVGLGGSDYVRDVLAGRALRSQLRPGQRVSVDDLSGVVVECGASSTLIAADDGRRVLVPNHLVREKWITLG